MSRLVTPKYAGSNFAAGGNSAKEYLERVAKYVPSEIVAAYVTINGLVPGAPVKAQAYLTVGNFFLCLILTPVYLSRMAAVGEPKKMHMAVSTIAFIIWAYAVAGNMGIFGPALLNWYNTSIASIILIIFTLVSGAFVPTAPPQPPLPPQPQPQPQPPPSPNS